MLVLAFVIGVLIAVAIWTSLVVIRANQLVREIYRLAARSRRGQWNGRIHWRPAGICVRFLVLKKLGQKTNRYGNEFGVWIDSPAVTSQGSLDLRRKGIRFGNLACLRDKEYASPAFRFGKSNSKRPN